MKKPVLRIVNADTGLPLSSCVGAVGSLVNLRADFLVDPPSGAVEYAWKARPKGCVRWGAYRTVPDFKREATLRGPGLVKLVAYDENGFQCRAEAVRITPSEPTGEA